MTTADPDDEAGRWSRGRAWLGQIALALLLWAMLGGVVLWCFGKL